MYLLWSDAVVCPFCSHYLVEESGFGQFLCEEGVEVIGYIDIAQNGIEAGNKVSVVPGIAYGVSIVRREVPVGPVNDERLWHPLVAGEPVAKEV